MSPEIDWTVIEKHRDDMKAKLDDLRNNGAPQTDPFAGLFDLAVYMAQYEMCTKLIKARIPQPVNG